MNYQVMRDLTHEEYRELKEDIAARGVMVPIEYDELENVLDGHHRLKICEELGIKTFPKIIRAGMTDSQKRMHARKLNAARRHLSREDKQELIRAQLAETPEKSDRQIAAGLGINHETVNAQRKEMESTGEFRQLKATIGQDGKVRPREVNRQPAPEQNLLENGNSLDAISEYIERASQEDREKLDAMDSEARQAVIDRIISGKENSVHNARILIYRREYENDKRKEVHGAGTCRTVWVYCKDGTQSREQAIRQSAKRGCAYL